MLLGAPGPLSVEEIGPVMLIFVPGVVTCSFTETEHEPFTATVPPLRLIEEEPGTAVTEPPQVLPTLFGEATTKPEGRLSVNASPVSGIVLAPGLKMPKFTKIVSFYQTATAEKDLLMVGGEATVRFAEVVLPVPPLVEVTAPVVLV